MTDSTIYHPRMTSMAASPYCELARWALDWWGIPFVEECHAPVFNLRASREWGRGNVVPLVDTGEATLLTAREVAEYYEARSPSSRKLYPSEGRAQTKELFDFFFDTFGLAAQAWAYANLLSARNLTLRIWTDRVPFWERLCAHIFYPFLASRVRRDLALEPETTAEPQAVIEAALARVEFKLADGRRFLMGERFTAADLALAALAAPILLPSEFAGSMPALNELPPRMRSDVERWRSRPAGQFILRLYRENRPRRTPDLVAFGKHGSGRTVMDRLLNFLIAPGVLRPVFALLRQVCPVFILGKFAIVTRYDDVVEVLKRDRDFTIREINEKKIEQIDGPFILGMDASPQYDQENAMLHKAVRREDLRAIREFVVQTAAELIEAAKPRRRIDVVNGLARVVPVRLVAAYFGMPEPDDPTMMRWMRDVFHFIFANLTNAPRVLEDALNSSAQLRRYMDAQIALRKSLRASKTQRCAIPDLLLAMRDESPGGVEHDQDDVLGRMLALQDSSHTWLDDNAVRRNLGGLIVGAVDTTSKFVAVAIDELLRRPKPLSEARAAALSGDIEVVRSYSWEAVRFNPHHPLQARYCPKKTRIAAGQKRSKSIPAGSSVYAATLSAMFDPATFSNPNEFNGRRESEYLHFGYGMHACFGRYINGVQVPELIAALLRLPNLRRAAGRAGQIVYDGPFPNRLVLEFDT